MKNLSSHLRFTALLAGLYLVVFPARAQTGTTVKGTVTNAATQNPQAFSTVILLQSPDSAAMNTSMTDEAGVYTFDNVRPGKYLVKAIMVGFAPAQSMAFEVKQQAAQVPAIPMLEQVNALQEVVVKGQKPVLEQLADRLVLNVEQLNTAGDNSLEVLKKAPGVRLDKDDNIVFRGSSSVNVMLNGKMTYMTGTELSNYLKSLPASAVSKVELIANPPASFDAAGTAGIINIVLKRDETLGLNGTANLSVGQGKYEKLSGGTNLNYNTGKVSLFARLHSGYYNSFNRLTLERNINDSLYRQVNYWHPYTKSLSYTAGADYFISKKHTIGVMLKGYTSPVDARTTSQSQNYDEEHNLFGRLRMENPSKSTGGNHSLNLNYKYDIDTTGRSLTFDADYVGYNSSKDEKFTNNYYDAAGEPVRTPEELRSFSSGDVSIKALKLDYVHPFGKGWKAEAGAKSSWVRNNNSIRFDVQQEEGWINDIRRTNRFVYTENINAAYLSLGKKISRKLSMKAGLRAERTVGEGNAVTTSESIKLDYWKLFPSLFVSYSANDNNQFSASYSRRISRPSYSSLNPFILYADPYTAIQGNPFLQPSYSNSLMASYTYKSFQLLSVSYLQKSDFVMDVIDQNDETKVSISTPQNLSQATSLRISSGGTLPITDWWNTDVQLTGAYDRVETPVLGTTYNSEQFAWEASADQDFLLPKNYKLQLSSYYSSSAVYGLSVVKANYRIDLGMKKILWNDKATVSLKLRDVFNSSRYRATLRYSNVDMFWQNQWESRRLYLSFDYKFGSSKVRTARNRKTGTSEEENRL